MKLSISNVVPQTIILQIITDGNIMHNQYISENNRNCKYRSSYKTPIFWKYTFMARGGKRIYYAAIFS
ncbi:MAG: hypothetical protein FWE33_00075 [Defluviitaleaceae bacterium]|nr:hypothetical protein [Defluviitaleaceae bacterium]